MARIAARASRGLAPLVVVMAVGRAAMASPLDGQLRAALGEIPPALTTSLATLEGRGPYLGILERKLNEGLAKGVSQARLAEALSRMADNLVWLDTRLGACARAGGTAETALAELGNDVLLSGVTRDALAPFLAATCAGADAAGAASRVADLHFYLVNKLMARPPDAWSLATLALAAPDAASGLSGLVVALQDVQRERGTVDRALSLATGRLREGASLRRVRAELEEHLLRR